MFNLLTRIIRSQIPTLERIVHIQPARNAAIIELHTQLWISSDHFDAALPSTCIDNRVECGNGDGRMLRFQSASLPVRGQPSADEASDLKTRVDAIIREEILIISHGFNTIVFNRW